MKTHQKLSFMAGEKAFSKIMDAGLSADDVTIVPGAAGGPKWLVLNALDRFLFGSWFANRNKPLFMPGSSIGSWRFAAASCKDPQAAIDRFESAYIRQSYRENPRRQDIDRQLEGVLDSLVGAAGKEEILAHPFCRLSVMTVRCRGPAGTDKRKILLAAMAAAAGANAVSRRALGLFFERTLFYHPSNKPPFYNITGFPINRAALDRKNIKPALLASGAVPLLMSGIRNIAGAPPGTYRDGGLIDYHLNIDLFENSRQERGIVLFPHYTEKIIPGWLDKHLLWKRTDFSALENTLMIAPSREFTRSLPCGKIPDRHDFYRFAGRDKQRMQYWQTVVERSRELAADFAEAVESGAIRSRLQPIKTRGGI